MNKNTFVALIAIAGFLSCNSGPEKKVLIFGRGSVTANNNDVTMKEGSGYAEETIELSGSKTAALNITTPTGKSTVNIPADKGFYILNIRNDTIVGSQQVLGTDISSNRTITQEELQLKIDSLTKLTKGENILSSGHSYMILPNQLVKISDNEDARVFGPFTKIPGTLEADKNGKALEIFKFYTNNEMRDLIANFKKMTYSKEEKH